MANRALARKKRCNIIPISPKALATSDVISPPRFAVRMSQIPWGDKHSSYKQSAW
jgi:hypothetical protein